MDNETKLQDYFLDQAIEERRNITIFMVNGYQMRGFVLAYDSSVIVISSEGKQMLLYKNAISTIVPERPITLLT